MLQEHLSSLPKDNLPNQWALDLLTAEKGEACLNEEFCHYINQSDQVEMKTKNSKPKPAIYSSIGTHSLLGHGMSSVAR